MKVGAGGTARHIVLPPGLAPLDRKIVRYALPLAAIGWGVAVFPAIIGLLLLARFRRHA